MCLETPKRTRKRKRNLNNWNRNIVKKNRLSGQEYKSRGKNKKQKSVQIYEHRCRYKCGEFTEDERTRLFSKLYSLPTYDLQTSFLASHINKSEPKRKTTNGKKQYSTEIKLLDRRVCREFFLKTFDISDSRFKVVCKKIDSDKFVVPDKRGKKVPKNKVPENIRKKVIDHINLFPRYQSHYSYNQNPNTRYLSTDLNIRKMYLLFKDYCIEQGETPVKESYYRNIFNTEFNLKFHHPHSDTCNKCDQLHNLVLSTQGEQKRKYEQELEVHQRKAKKATTSKETDIEKSKISKNTITICFDLQKTLPTPLLTTNKVYYLRQLWTYNFCIFDLTNGVPHMYVWHESIASRGSQEVGSCLLHVSDKF